MNDYASLGLLVKNATTTFDVLSYSRGRQLPGGASLRRPKIGSAQGAHLPNGATEIAATMLDARGHRLDEFGWSSSSREFHDYVDKRGNARGFATSSESRTRAFLLRVPRGAASIVFRLLRKGAKDKVLKTILLSGKGANVKKARNVFPIDFQTQPRSRVVPHGRIDAGRSHRTHDGPNDPRFDIVITGDGFAARDIKRFLKEARFLVKDLRTMEPFRSLDEKINYHTLVAVSEQSGITGGKAGPRKTYFQSRTEFVKGFPEIIGTAHPELIKSAVETVIRPWCEIDLVIVIANANVNGGYSFRQHGTVFIAHKKKHPLWMLTYYAAHEGGHVIAKLADEYISGSRYDPDDKRPNVATAEQLEAKAVPWMDLARKKGMLRPDGYLKLVHNYDSAWNLQTQEPKLEESDMQRVGAFWGCMYTKPAVGPSRVSRYDDYRGADFYRPSARCLMRKLERDYCAVCADAVAQAIERKVREHKQLPADRRPTVSRGDYRPTPQPLAARPPQHA